MKPTETPAQGQVRNCIGNILQENDSTTSCVIMASGMGVRFGSNKLLADFGGKPMLQWILDATDHTFLNRVVVTRHREIEKLCMAQGIPVILHEFPGRNDTVRLGLEAVGKEAGACMFCTADQPFVQRETIQRMVSVSGQESDKIIRLSYGEQEGNPVIFPRWTFEELLHLPEGKGGGVVMNRYRDFLVKVSALEERELVDIDTVEEYEKYRSVFGK